LKIYTDSEDVLLSNLMLIDKFKLIKFNNKYGLINLSNSKLLLSPIYDKISMFNIFGYLKIKIDNKIGIYDPFKEIEIVKPNYKNINKTSINYNLLIVNKDNKYGIYFNGKLFLNSYFENILQYKNVINIKSDNEWLVYNSELIKLNYIDFEVIETFNKYEILKYNDVYGIGDKQEIVVAFAFEEFEIKLNKLLIGNLSDETIVVFDENFNFIIEPNYYNEIDLLNDLFFRVRNKNHIGVLSIIGEILIPVKYFSCQLIDNSFFLTFRKNWSAIDLKGKIIYSSQKKQITIDKAKEIISIEEKKKKIKELGYEIKKIQKEKNITQFLNKLTLYENCISNYDNIEKTIRLINVLREFNINLKTVIDQFENTNKIDSINVNSKITLAEYHFIKIMNERKI